MKLPLFRRKTESPPVLPESPTVESVTEAPRTIPKPAIQAVMEDTFKTLVPHALWSILGRHDMPIRFLYGRYEKDTPHEQTMFLKPGEDRDNTITLTENFPEHPRNTDRDYWWTCNVEEPAAPGDGGADYYRTDVGVTTSGRITASRKAFKRQDPDGTGGEGNCVDAEYDFTISGEYRDALVAYVSGVLAQTALDLPERQRIYKLEHPDTLYAEVRLDEDGFPLMPY